LFFFLHPRRPPTSPLFPYTTLFRSVLYALSPVKRHFGIEHGMDMQDRYGALQRCILFINHGTTNCRNGCNLTRLLSSYAIGKHRSEEHMSELQSRENLVCRLLLEKK